MSRRDGPRAVAADASKLDLLAELGYGSAHEALLAFITGLYVASPSCTTVAKRGVQELCLHIAEAARRRTGRR